MAGSTAVDTPLPVSVKQGSVETRHPQCQGSCPTYWYNVCLRLHEDTVHMMKQAESVRRAVDDVSNRETALLEGKFAELTIKVLANEKARMAAASAVTTEAGSIEIQVQGNPGEGDASGGEGPRIVPVSSTEPAMPAVTPSLDPDSLEGFNLEKLLSTENCEVLKNAVVRLHNLVSFFSAPCLVFQVRTAAPLTRHESSFRRAQGAIVTSWLPFISISKRGFFLTEYQCV
ncbi:unnamed protein product [Discosporangium mesarthrocarpum]